jgi:hypothetical protein
MRCACQGVNPGHVIYLGQWADGPSDQGEWCTCCLSQLLDAIAADPDEDRRELTLRFLVTLAVNPDQYVREEPADPTGWDGRFPCWHPTNCQTREKHIEKLKKSRSKSVSRVSKIMTNFRYSYWPYSYDQISFTSPFPYIVTPFVAGVILERVDATHFPPNPHVVLSGGLRVMGHEGLRHN